MKKILLLEENQDIINLIQSNMTTEFGHMVEPITDIEKAIKEAKLGAVDLIITKVAFTEKLNIDNVAEQVINAFSAGKLSVPIITLGDPKMEEKDYFPLPEKFLISELMEVAKRIFAKNELKTGKEEKSGYFAVPIQNFYLIDQVNYKVFIRIQRKDANDQYILRIKPGQNFDINEIQRYEKKGVTNFFIENELRFVFLDELFQKVGDQIKPSENSVEELVKNSEGNFKIAQDLLSKMGLNEYTYRIGEGSVNSMMETITWYDDQLTKLVSGLLGNTDSFAFKHSYLIAVFAHSFLPKLDLPQEKLQVNMESMLFAAFYHDILLNDDRLVRIQTKSELFDEKLNEEETELVNNHARRTAEMVGQFPKIPPDAEQIILEHHGMTNGVGFIDRPKANLHPLSIVFIVLEEFVHRFLNFTRGQNLKDILVEMEDFYQIPSFRKVVAGLRSAIIENFKN